MKADAFEFLFFFPLLSQRLTVITGHGYIWLRTPSRGPGRDLLLSTFHPPCLLSWIFLLLFTDG